MVVWGPLELKTQVVFPICDMRRFTGDPDMVLLRPFWPLPEPHKEFIRALGGLKAAEDCGLSQRGLTGWIVEPYVCDARLGPKFKDMPAMKSPYGHSQWRVDKRLLFFDGSCSARAEYHFEIDLKDQAQAISFDLINDFLCGLQLQMRVHEGEDKSSFETVDFGRSGLLHTRALAARTVPHSQFSKLHSVRKHIKYLRPTIVHVVEEGEKVEIGSQFIRVRQNSSKYIDVFHDRVRIFSNIDIPVWVIFRQKAANDRDLRDLSLYLRRLHSEFECLKVIFRAIERNQIKLDDGHLPEEVEQYLREILSRVRTAENKLERTGNFSPQDDESLPSMIDLASVSIHDLDPTLPAQIRNALARAKFKWTSNRNQSKIFVDQWFDRATSVTFNVRELNMDNSQNVSHSSGVVLTQAGPDAQVKIDKSFNGFQDNTSNAELVQALANLKELVDQAIEAGDVESPEALARDFSELSEEAGSEAPRKEKVEFSGKMILSAIKESSSLVTSIGKAVSSIGALF